MMQSPQGGLCAETIGEKVVMCPCRGNEPTSGHPRQASFIRGGGGYFGQDPPTQLGTHSPNL